MWASGQKTALPSSSLVVSAGDIAAFDYDKNDFTWDSTWYELDMSAKIPASAKLVHLRVRHIHTATNNWMKFRKNGYSNIFNMAEFNTRVASVSDQSDVWVEVDADSKIAYQGGSIPLGFDVAVRGWII